MNGGHFYGKQWSIIDITDEIEFQITNNKYEYSDKTINEFKKAVNILKQAYIYTQRIDWLLSGDDGEDSFHERLKDELEENKNGELEIFRDMVESYKSGKPVCKLCYGLKNEHLDVLCKLLDNK
jgi:hypothetical protein